MITVPNGFIFELNYGAKASLNRRTSALVQLSCYQTQISLYAPCFDHGALAIFETIAIYAPIFPFALILIHLGVPFCASWILFYFYILPFRLFPSWRFLQVSYESFAWLEYHNFSSIAIASSFREWMTHFPFSFLRQTELLDMMNVVMQLLQQATGRTLRPLRWKGK